MQKQLLPKYGISSANLHIGEILTWGRGVEIDFSAYLQQHLIWNQSFQCLHSIHKMPKQELWTLLLSSTITETDFRQIGLFWRTTWQDFSHLSFDGVSFTMDHCVWSHYAVWTWICLHHFELHSTHPSPNQEDVTCKTSHFSSLLQLVSAKCYVLYCQQPQRTRKQIKQKILPALITLLQSCMYWVPKIPSQESSQISCSNKQQTKPAVNRKEYSA